MSEVLSPAEDPLEQIRNRALRTTLNVSCEDLKFYDYLAWNAVVSAIKLGEPILNLPKRTEKLLLSASPKKIRALCSGSISSFAVRQTTTMNLPSIPQDLMRAYVQQHRLTVNQHGNSYATQIYGITESESETLFRISAFLDGVRFDRYRLVLRCSVKTLERLLLSKPEEETFIRFKKIMECLGEGDTVMPHCVRKESNTCYSADTREGKANTDQANKLIAAQMLAQGFSVAAVSIEVGLSARQARLIANQTRDAKYAVTECRPQSKVTRTAHAILRTNKAALHVTLLMRIYINLGGELIQNSTCVRSIVTAYSIYSCVRHDVYGLFERTNTQRLSMHDAWILAVDYRSKNGYLSECGKCNVSVYRSSVQRATTGCSCPFCDEQL